MSVGPRQGAAHPRGTPDGPEDGAEDARELVLAYYEAFNALDFEAVRTLCAPGVVLVVEGGRLQGHDELIAYFNDLHHHFPGIRPEVHVTSLTHRLVVIESSFPGDSSGATRGTEWSLNGRQCEIFEIEGGRITTIRNYYVTAGGDRIGEADVLRPSEAYKLSQEQAAPPPRAALVARDPTPTRCSRRSTARSG